MSINPLQQESSLKEVQLEEQSSPPVVVSASPSASAKKKAALTSTQKQRKEDFCGMLAAFAAFALSTFLAFEGKSLKAYEKEQQWPLGAAGLAMAIICFAHYFLSDEEARLLALLQAVQVSVAYAFPLLLAVASKSIGAYEAFKTSGLTASFWAIMLGMLFHSAGVKSDSRVKSGEFFIKIGVTLLAIDYEKIISLGGPGLVVAWVDTLLVLSIGYALAHYVFSLSQKQAVVLAGATSICGSSAATAIATVLYPGEREQDKKERAQIVDPIVALMGLLNTPLMPLLPIANTLGSLSAETTGAWIGGCVDSTGQVVASASLSSDTVLQTATIVKIAQNFLIGPVCLALSLIFRPEKELEESGSSDREAETQNGCVKGVRLVAQQFPVFVLGFFVTSAAVTLINALSSVDGNTATRVIDNSWTVAEWVNLVGFACIGLKIDALALFRGSSSANSGSQQTQILQGYCCIQALDVLTTLGFAVLMFRNVNVGDDQLDDDI